MDDIRSGVTLDPVTKPHPVEKRRRLFKSSEWDLEEPAAFSRIARSRVELALITGVVIRLFPGSRPHAGQCDQLLSWRGAGSRYRTLFFLPLGWRPSHLGSSRCASGRGAPLFAVF